MKLLVISQYFWPENFKINDLVEGLAQRGHEVVVLTGLPSYPDRDTFKSYSLAPEKFARYKGVQIVRVPLVKRGNSFYLFLNYFSFAIFSSLIGAWKLRGKSIDCIFVYEPSPITVGIPGALMRRLKRAPMAFWVQDLWPETLVAVGAVKSPRLLNLVTWLVRFIYARCDLILAQSRSFIPQIAKHCHKTDSIVYYPNWADTIYEEKAQVAAPEVETAVGVFTVMFAGNLGEAQNFPAILDAADRLKYRSDIRWVIVGDGRMFDAIKGDVQRRGLQDRLVLLGRFPVDRMASFFQHADALLVSLKPDPVLAATIPAKVQTYLAAGIPVLAMMDGEGATLVQRAEAGLVCAAGDSVGLADAVARLAAMSPDARAAMGQRGRDITAAEFDRDAQIEKLEGWLADLVARFPAMRRRAL